LDLFLASSFVRLELDLDIHAGGQVEPVRFAVLTISLVDASRIRWSKALSLILMFWLCISMVLERRRAR